MNTKHGIFLAMFGILVFCAFIGTASAATIYVPDDYAKIQWAIDNAIAGYTIIVRDGTYSENVDVDKRLTIRSENGPANCIVDAADQNDYVFKITADYVNISGFTMEGATRYRAGICLHYANHCNITNNNASNNDDGILLRWSSNNTLANNNASNNDDGILLRWSSNNTLTNNIMSANKYKNFGVRGHSLSKFTHNIDTSNKVDGKPIYYLIDEKNKQIPSDAGYVGIVNCINITVKNLTLTNNGQGVLLAYSSNSRIENVIVSNSYEGIYLYYSSNNTLTNNNVHDGIYLEDSDSNTLTNNNASDNYVGIHLEDSSNNILTNNNASDNYVGIRLEDSSNNTLTNNNALNNDDCGVYLYSSSNNTLTNNIMSANKYNFGVDGGSLSEFIHNIDTSNKVDGKPIYYLIDEKNKQIPSDAGYVGIVNCINITVKNLTLTNNGQGVLLANSSNSRIEDVIVSNNDDDGIYLYYSNNNTLTNNNAPNNCYGIHLEDSNSNTLTNNNASNNRVGIDLEDSSNNRLTNNNASNNWKKGIDLWYSNNNILTNNNASYNDVGICLDRHSSDNEIAKNNAYPNEGRGIERDFSSKRNKIYMNNFNGSISTFGAPQIEFGPSPETSLLVHFHYSQGVLVGATAYAGFENTGGSGTVEIVAQISYDTTIIAAKGSTFDVKSDGTYPLEIEIKMCEVGVGIEEDYDLVLSSPSASSSYEIGLGRHRSLSASISAINLTPSTNLWNSTGKINYTYKGKNYTNYLGNYWTDYEGIDANRDGIGDTPYSIDSDEDYYPLMEPWENYFKPPEEEIFDTGAPANPYPSIFGTHNGTIKPNQTITVFMLYTYPCAGTGGHSEYVAFYNATTGEVIVNGTWNGYQGAGDYHYIEFFGPFTLEANVTYNYTIKTGSYPQIHHNRTLIVPDGEITCTEYIDANGKRYDNWIPAIKLE